MFKVCVFAGTTEGRKLVEFISGQDAYVSKFIIKVDRINPTDDWMPTVESTGFVGQYLSGNGEILKYDVLHTMEFDNIVALENYKDSKYENEIEQTDRTVCCSVFVSELICLRR